MLSVDDPEENAAGLGAFEGAVDAGGGVADFRRTAQ